MQTTFQKVLLAVLVLSAPFGYTDTFTHTQTGESFDGFKTQKSVANKTRIYNSEQKKMISVDLSEYTVEPNRKGRKDVAVVVPINVSETLLSEVIAKEIAKTIVDASNRGVQVIIVHIDNPGGRGDYMKIITSAIEQTKNCPVAAYISPDAYGGAYSTAAVIALACDTIYIHPTATMGTIGPMGSLGSTQEDFADYLTTYCSKTLILQGVDTEAQRLAEAGGRPGLVAKALVDKELSVVEVANVDGSRQFISKNDRQPTQTIVQTLSEGAAPSSESNTISPADAVRLTLKLTADDAIKIGLADATAGGYYDILTAMDIQEAKISYTSSMNGILKKYQAARRNMSENLARIDWLEKQVSTLEDQVEYIDEQLRTGMQTREVRRGGDGVYQRSSARDNLPDDYDDYYYDPVRNTTTTTSGVATRNRGRRSDRTQSVGSETVMTTEPTTLLVDAQRELARYLEDLVSEYQRAVNLAKRWPGSLPPEVPRALLERNVVATESSLGYLYTEIQEGAGQQNQQRRTTRTSGASRNR